MLNVLQATPSLNAPFLPAADPNLKVLEKQQENRHAGIKPQGADTGSVEDDVLDVATAAAALDPALGLVSTLTLSDAAEQYIASARLLVDAAAGKTSAKNRLALDI